MRLPILDVTVISKFESDAIQFTDHSHCIDESQKIPEELMMKLLQLPLILVSVITSYGYAESAFEQGESSHHEHHAHEHGVARMNIIGDKNLLSITFTIPMLNVTGFEQTPENDSEQKILDDKIALIEKINQWLTLNQQAGCELTQHSVQIDSENEHPDIDFDIHYQCNKPE